MTLRCPMPLPGCTLPCPPAMPSPGAAPLGTAPLGTAPLGALSIHAYANGAVADGAAASLGVFPHQVAASQYSFPPQSQEFDQMTSVAPEEYEEEIEMKTAGGEDAPSLGRKVLHHAWP